MLSMFNSNFIVHLYSYGHYAEGTGSVLKMANIDVRFPLTRFPMSVFVCLLFDVLDMSKLSKILLVFFYFVYFVYQMPLQLMLLVTSLHRTQIFSADTEISRMINTNRNFCLCWSWGTLLRARWQICMDFRLNFVSLDLSHACLIQPKV